MTASSGPPLSADEFRNLAARHAAILAAIPDIVMEVDCNKVYTWANQAGLEFFGSDVLGKEAAYYFAGPQDTYEKVEPLFDGSEDVFYVESWQRRRDGEVRLLAWWCRVLKDANGEVSGALYTARDITTERQNEQRTQHLNAILRAIRNVNQLICREPDRARLLQGACDCLVETRGHTAAWIVCLDRAGKPESVAETGLGRDKAKLLDDLRRAPLGHCLRTALEQPDVCTITEPSIVCADCVLACGAAGHAISVTRLARGAQVLGILGIVTPAGRIPGREEASLLNDVAADIALALHSIEQEAQRKRAEDALRETAERYQSLFETSRDGIVFVALDGRIEEANPAYLDMLGYTLGEVRKLNFKDLTPKKWAAFEADIVENQIMKRGYSDEYEKEYIRRDGTVFPVSVRGWRVTDRYGRPLRMFGIVRDLTARKRIEEERRQLEAQLRRAQKMEAIGQLAGGIAHDFNNILTAVLGNVELLRGQMEPALAPDDARLFHLDQIERAAHRAASLTRQLLTFSRRQTVKLAPLNLNHALDDIATMLNRLIGENIALQFTLADDLPTILADTGQIEQLVMNLVVNARDAMPNGGVVQIETSLSHLDEAYVATHAGARLGPHVTLLVADTGTGMAPDILEHIFEPFFTTKPVGQGTGLGLATVYGIVQQMGGHIAVYSEPGHGSAFRIHFPVDTTTPGSQPADTRPSTARGGDETILVCEDDPTVRALATGFLRAAGYFVLTAADGHEALRLATQHAGPVHLLLTDVIMPDLNGRELAARIAALCPALKVLFMSGYTANVVAQHGVLDPGVDLLQKPFGARTLLDRVRAALDGSPTPVH